MKTYKKSDLTLNHGLLVTKDGDIVMPDICVVDQANALETLAQTTAYLNAQPSATPMPSLDGFERKSIKDSSVRKFTASTPLIDRKAREAMAIMGEIDDVATVEAANAMLGEFAALLEFVVSDNVIDCGDQLYYFDTPTLGSVLELTVDDITKVVADACGMVEEGITVHDDNDDHDEFVAAIPATKENLDKFREFFDSIIDDDCGKAGHPMDEADGEDILDSLNKLAHEVNDLCNDFENTEPDGE